MCDILYRVLSSCKLATWYLAIWILCMYEFNTVLLLSFTIYGLYLLVIRGVPKSDHRTNTGFGSIKLTTCGWLLKGRSHSIMYMEFSSVW